MFQFQYGTIKSISISKDSILSVLFQFQYGTIKSIQNFKYYAIGE